MIKLSEQDRAALHQAQEEAAKRTSARIAVLTVPVSDRYKLYSLVYAAAAALLTFTVIAAYFSDLSLRTAFMVTAGAAIVTGLITEYLPVRLLLISRHAKNWECWELSHRAFAARILAQNDRKTGILFFVSFGERYVEVVTDRDVDLHVPQRVWDAIIKAFLLEAKAGRAGAALPKAIEACATVLAEHYPPAPQDQH